MLKLYKNIISKLKIIKIRFCYYKNLNIIKIFVYQKFDFIQDVESNNLYNFDE